jgi:hypothetical protein
MDFTSAITGLFRILYRRRGPTAREPRKPVLKWLPKYEVAVGIPGEVLAAEEPHRELEGMLEDFGFSLEAWTPGRVNYARGKAWGDFSVKLIRIRVSFPTPLEAETTMRVEVADLCLFDTGDLWRLTGRLAERLAAPQP